MNENLKILVADDHSLVRQGLKLELLEMSAAATILEATDAETVRQVLSMHPDIDLVILDLHMPGANELELLSSLCNKYPDIPVVILSAVESPRVMQRTIDRGAAGFIPKSVANEVLISALQLTLSGGVYIPSQMIGETPHNSYTDQSFSGETTSISRRSTSVRPVFTDRQNDVLQLLSDGNSNKAIARKLGLSEHTIKIHLTAIFKTLGVSNRTEAAIACRELGLHHPE
jgi:DNA-binding NarL/FixJ family response regulator